MINISQYGGWKITSDCCEAQVEERDDSQIRHDALFLTFNKAWIQTAFIHKNV